MLHIGDNLLSSLRCTGGKAANLATIILCLAHFIVPLRVIGHRANNSK